MLFLIYNDIYIYMGVSSLNIISSLRGKTGTIYAPSQNQSIHLCEKEEEEAIHKRFNLTQSLDAFVVVVESSWGMCCYYFDYPSQYTQKSTMRMWESSLLMLASSSRTRRW